MIALNHEFRAWCWIDYITRWRSVINATTCTERAWCNHLKQQECGYHRIISLLSIRLSIQRCLTIYLQSKYSIFLISTSHGTGFGCCIRSTTFYDLTCCLYIYWASRHARDVIQIKCVPDISLTIKVTWRILFVSFYSL